MSAPSPRIVSLLPSCTEIVCALGFGEHLVGRSHECDFPAGVRRLPVCTSARLDDGSSRAIDDQVKRLVHDGLSIYDVDAARLRELEPTLILTQDQCEVCAASLGDLEAALADWTGAHPQILSLSPQTLGDVWRDIARVGEALASHGGNERAQRLVEALTGRLAAVAERVGARPQPTVACIEWLDPLMAAGNWVPELAAVAGGRALFAQAGAHSPWLEWKELQRADPDVLVLMPCGFDMQRTSVEAAALTRLPAFETLSAVRSGRVAIVDGNAFFNRPGPRLAESAEILASIFHPEGGGRAPDGPNAPGTAARAWAYWRASAT